MARTLTPKDAHSLMNILVKQATGQQTISVVDTSTFVSAGEKVLATGMENVINSLNIILARTMIASRPYKAKLSMMEEMNSGVYSSRLRKISFYSKDALSSGAFNTDLFTNIAEGYTAGENADSSGTPHSTKSQYEQNQPVCLEMNFGGSSTWQDCITIYEEQIQTAFRDEASFNGFIAGYITEHGNDIQTQKEAWNRMNLLNKIASVYDMASVMNGSVINLTAAFNDKFGTTHTSKELRTTYLKEFLEFFVSEFKLASMYMTERTKNYHWSPAKTVGQTSYSLLRHTPYNKQRVYLYEPLFVEAKAMVLPEIFNPDYLDINTQYEGVTFWQNENSRASINVTPAVVNTSTGVQEAGTTVNIPYVIGMITDVDGLMTNFQLERAATTPLEARKLYRNTWLTFLRNNINDNTENCIIFVMEDDE